MSIPSRLAPVALGLSLLCAPFTVRAASYEQLLQLAQQAPQQRHWQLQQTKAEAAKQQAALLDNPSLTLEGDGLYGSGAYRDRAQAEYRWQLSQPLDVWGERTARQRIAQAELDRVGVESQQARWQWAATLATHFLAVELAQRQLALGQRSLQDAEADLAAVQRAVALGREAALREIHSRSELAALSAVVDSLRAAQTIATAELALLLPQAQEPLTIDGSLLERLPLADASPSALSFQRLQALQRQAQAQLAQVQAAGKPQFRATLGNTRYANGQGDAVMLGLEMTLPLFDRGQAAERSALAEVEMGALAAEQALREQEVQARIIATQLQLAEQQLAAAATQLQDTEKLYQLARQGYGAGRLSERELRAARQDLYAAEQRLLALKAARADSEIKQAQHQARAPFLPQATGVKPQ